MKLRTSFQITAVGLFAAIVVLGHISSQGEIVAPYTPDADTLHLWHMDTGTPVVDQALSGGTNLTGLLAGATLGNPSYPGFGSALNTVDGGQDSTTERNATLCPGAAVGNVSITYADATTGAFTFEAIVWIGFDPTKNLSTHGACQIISGESLTGVNRIFQFRIMPLGTISGLSAPALTFENIRAGSSSQPTIYALIPTSGPDAILSNNWYHVAVSYNGVPNSANNVKLYWTLLDPSRTSANQISIASPTTTLSGLNPLSTGVTPFMVGNLGRNQNGNFLGMIDEVRISKVERTAVQMAFKAIAVIILTQPASQIVAAGDTVTLSVLANGESPQYSWQFYGTNLNPVLNPSATNASLVLTNITPEQAGPYQVIISNNVSSKTSDVAVVTVGAVMSEVFNTGVDTTGALLPGGAVDGHWQLIESADPNNPGPAAYVASSLPGSYLPSGPNSMWIAPAANANAAGGVYTYRTTFLIDTLDSAKAQLSGSWAIDNVGLDILLNGNSLGLTAVGQQTFTFFTVTNYFVPGVNTLDVVTTNYSTGGNNPTALRVQMRGTAALLPPTAPYLTGFPSDVTTQAQQTATFQVAAVGSGPLSYQWYHDSTLLTSRTTRTLVLSSLTSMDAGSYTVVVTNSLGSTNATALLNVITPPALAWLGVDPVNPSFWDTVTTNWLDTGGLANVTFAPLDDVLFDSRGSATPSVYLAETLNPNSVMVDAATDYSFSGPGSLAGTLVLTKKNTGTLVVDTLNTYDGTTTIEEGTLQVGNFDAAGTLGNSVVSNNAALVFNRFDTFTVPNSISGTGSVTMAGSGTLVLAGNNTYTGPTLINFGIINANGSTALGTVDSGTMVAPGAQLYLDPNVNLGAEPLTISGFGLAAPQEGALRKGGGGSGTIFGGPITLAADAGIKVDASGTLNLTNAAGITGADVSLAVQADSTGVRGIVAGPITLGAGSFTQYGAGTWALLSTSNSWTGTTTINSPAVLQIGDGGNNGSLGGSAIQNDGTLTFLSANDLVISNVISGGGAVNQNGTGMVTFTTANSYSGVTTIRGSGVLRITDGGALGSGQCTIGAAQTDTCRLELLGGITVNNQIAIFPRVFYQTPPPAPVVAPDILNVSGTNILNPPGSITIGIGGNLLTLQADSGHLMLNAGVTAAGVGRHLALRGAATGEILGNIDHTGNNSQFVWKLDSGTWTLWGAMTPGAATTISNGVLVLNGSLDNVLTNAGGTLGGTGVISGPVYINAGAALAPGASIGTMTMSNTLTLQPGSFTSMEINQNDGTMDHVIGMTSVRYGGTLQVTLSGTPQIGDAFKLFDADSYSGTFASISPASPGSGLLWLTNTLATDGKLRIQGTNVLAATINSVVQSDGSLLFSGGGGAPWGGYSVVSSTNVTLPSASWTAVAFGVFDGSGQFSTSVLLDPAAPARFFQVRAP